MGLKAWSRVKSPWIMFAPCGGCNGCHIEIVACLTPRYDVERLGIKITGSPRQADILVVAGHVSKQITKALKRIYEQIPDPKVVVAVGSCALTGGVFYGEGDYVSYGLGGPVNKIIPVDVYVPGCPPKPEAIIHGIALAIQKLKEKSLGKRG